MQNKKLTKNASEAFKHLVTHIVIDNQFKSPGSLPNSTYGRFLISKKGAIIALISGVAASFRQGNLCKKNL